MKSKTPRIFYEPYTKIVVKHCLKMRNKEELAYFSLYVDGEDAVVLQWANGVLFDCRVGEGEYAESQRLKGAVHFIFVFFCTMPEYTEEIAITLPNGMPMYIPVLNLNEDPVYGTLATWLKDQGTIYAMA